MKILMITPYLPYPLLSGGQIRSYNLIKHLARDHEITLVSFIRKPQEKEYVNSLLKYCKDVKLILRKKAFSPINILLAGLTHMPFLVAIYYSPKAKKVIYDLLSKEHFDLIHAETFYIMPNIPKTDAPTLLVEQTIEYLVYDHFVSEFKLFLAKPLLYYDVLKIKFFENLYWRKADKVVAMSESDAQIMKKLVPNLDVGIVPNGVDSKFFEDVKRKKDDQKVILFVGNFKWLQNREAASYLITKIWPNIIKHFPNSKLWIVGKNPSPELKNLSKQVSGIVLDEKVEDIRIAYQGSDLLIAPIFGPGGTRYKILEAMASGIPVITTSTGIEGIPAENGKDVIIRETAEELTSAAIELLGDSKI